MSIPGLDKNIGSLLEKAAEQYGNKTLLHFTEEDLSLTFIQMNHAVNQYAHVLQKPVLVEETTWRSCCPIALSSSLFGLRSPKSERSLSR